MQPTLTQRENALIPSQPQTSKGLNSETVRRLLIEHGFNEPVAQQKAGAVLQFLRFFANPLVAILLIASGISAAVGDQVNAVIIVVMVLMSVTLNFAQAARSQRAA